jgi:hypothetical protein
VNIPQKLSLSLVLLSLVGTISVARAASKTDTDVHNLPPRTTTRAQKPNPGVTKRKCVDIKIDLTKPILLLTPTHQTTPYSKVALKEKIAKEPYKVVMTVGGEDDWQVFQDYQAAKDFMTFVKKNGSYKLCTFTSPEGDSWTETVISEEHS